MKTFSLHLLNSYLTLVVCCALHTGLNHNVSAQAPDGPPPGFDGPPPFGPGGMNQEETKLLSQFDTDKTGFLNQEERKSAREFLKKEKAEGRIGGGRRFGPPGGMGRPGGPGGPGRSEEPKKPGALISPNEIRNYPDKPLYDPTVIRTVFLNFENSDWEKELSEFHDTDVEVPAKLTVDGNSYENVGVHFRGMSSYMMVGEGSKRSLNLSLDMANKKQNLGGYRTLNLMNSHEDPSFLRAVLSYQIERDYIPAPKASFVRVVINGENWGIYVNVEQFNKDFIKEWFGTSGGARWKVRGNPAGQGSLAYLGDDVEAYKKIYTIKSKDDPKRWADFIQFCKILNQTPADKLEAALSPILDVQGALKFIALDNTLINNDGYWIRTSDYSIYQDENRKFHILPQDSNETFVKPGGPGFGGGPGGGRGGQGRFGPGSMLASQLMSQGDKDQNHELSNSEFSSIAEAWYNKLDTHKAGSLKKSEFESGFTSLLPAPEGFSPPGAPQGGGRNMGPGSFISSGLFTASDSNHDDSLTREEWKATFEKWFKDWDTEHKNSLTEDKLKTGLSAAIPRGGPGGGPNGPDRRGGPGGPGRSAMPQIKGVELDPLIAANDTQKPLISKLLAVPAWRAQYLAYVRDISTKWLDWNKLGPIAQQYHSLIAEDIKVDTRKLDSTEDFVKSLTEDIAGSGMGPGGGGTISLKNFADQRRQFLLAHPEIQKLAK